MASQNGNTTPFSVGEVVGISAAAAVALGGIIIALGRAQSHSSEPKLAVAQSLPSRKQVRKAAERGKKRANVARKEASRRYPDARDRATDTLDRTSEAARVYGAEMATKAEAGLERAKHQGSELSHRFQESVLPAVATGAARLRDTVAEQARETDTDELVETARHYADEAAEQLRHAGETVSKRFQDDVLPAVTPFVKDATSYAEDTLGRLKDRAGDARRSNGRVPGAKAVASGKQSAQNALQTTSKAASDSFASVLWLAISGALVYFILLSPERREQVKSAVYDAVEQVRLLIGDFKGYETEF